MDLTSKFQQTRYSNCPRVEVLLWNLCFYLKKKMWVNVTTPWSMKSNAHKVAWSFLLFRECFSHLSHFEMIFSHSIFCLCVYVYALSIATNSSKYFLSILIFFHILLLQSGKWPSMMHHLYWSVSKHFWTVMTFNV